MTLGLKRKKSALVADLTPEQRVEVADFLYASILSNEDLVINQARDEDNDHRLDDHEAGKSKPIASAKVHAQLGHRQSGMNINCLASAIAFKPLWQ